MLKLKRLIKNLKIWWAIRQKEKLHPSERGYINHPQMSERIDGRLVTNERKIRCEVPESDGSGDICVNALPVGESCNSHWCLRSDYRGRIYGHYWES